MPQFFVSPENVRDGRALLDAAESHHLRNVFGARPGTEVDLFDGRGRALRARIAGFDSSGRVEAEILSENAAPSNGVPGISLVLGQCVFQFSRMDELVCGASELGIARFLPVLSARSNFAAAQVEKRRPRWDKIALSAAKQCGRACVPEIAAPVGFRAALEMSADCGLRVFGAVAPAPGAVNVLRSRLRELADAGRGLSVFILVGPEGGLGPEEEKALASAGFLGLNVAPHILRAGTAALALTAVLGHEINAAFQGAREET